MALTPQARLRREILATLDSLPDNRGTRAVVLEAMNDRLGTAWSVEDLESVRTHPGEPKWRNRASFERAAMVRDGLMSNSETGIWMLTDQGRREIAGLHRLEEESTGWAMNPGEDFNRADRAAVYGGAEQGGIQPSTTSHNVFLYSDPSRGASYGYNYDGWDSTDDLFLYTGEGRRGDQRLRSGNKALLNHVTDGRRLRLFVADGFEANSRTKRQIYVGEFAIDHELPYTIAEATDEDQLLRTVIVFRLRPVGDFLRRVQDHSAARDVGLRDAVSVIDEPKPGSIGEASTVETERVNSLQFTSASTATSVEGQRREAILTQEFQQYLAAKSHLVQRLQIRPAAGLSVLFSDLYDATEGALYEAKGSSTRESVRMAIGQLLDYGRFAPRKTRLSLLLPVRPAADLISLLESLNIGLVVRTNSRVFETVLTTTMPRDPEVCGRIVEPRRV